VAPTSCLQAESPVQSLVKRVKPLPRDLPWCQEDTNGSAEVFGAPLAATLHRGNPMCERRLGLRAAHWWAAGEELEKPELGALKPRAERVLVAARCPRRTRRSALKSWSDHRVSTTGEADMPCRTPEEESRIIQKGADLQVFYLTRPIRDSNPAYCRPEQGCTRRRVRCRPRPAGDSKPSRMQGQILDKS
jgi:hypothetical protein